jgi:hypothetical protein
VQFARPESAGLCLTRALSSVVGTASTPEMDAAVEMCRCGDQGEHLCGSDGMVFYVGMSKWVKVTANRA